MTRKFLEKLPKVDLHCHLDGSIRVETIRDLANISDMKLPTQDIDELRNYVQVNRDCRSLKDFLDKFEFFYPLLKNQNALERISYELCEDARKENIRYLEVRFAPVLQQEEGFSMEDALKSVIRGMSQGSADFKIGTGIILCCYRLVGIPLESSFETAKLAVKYFGKGVSGLDLAGDEKNFPARLYKDAFRLAIEAGIPLTAHAGEEGGADSVREALDILKVKRIGHGTHMGSDPDLLKRLRDENITIEVCLTSNIQTCSVESYEVHPFMDFYRQGLSVTLNTDDRGVSDIDLTHELEVAVEKLGLGLQDVSKIMLNGVNGLFREESEKKEIAGEFRKEYSAYINQGGGYDVS